MFAAPMHEPLSDDELRRYSRHLKLAEIGENGQARLKTARVVLIGTGGLGSPAALYLAAAGVGTLGLVDYDAVDESNLQRQVLFDTASVGDRKTHAARQRLMALNPGTRVIEHDLELCAANVRALFADYDLVLDGSDRLGTRYLVNDACVLYRKPLVSAAIHRFEGQLMSYVPEQGPCYRCLFPNPAEGQVPNCADVGVLGVLPGVLGTLAATEAIKLVVGIGTPLIGRLLTYDALEMRFSEFRFARRADCAVCGTRPSISAPADPAGFVTLEELSRVPGVDAKELSAMLADRERRPLTLIDVREPDEFAQGALPGSVNLPLGALEPHLPGLPRAGTLLFVCRSGARSRRAGALARRGGQTALTLQGGLLAYRDSVDGSLQL
jgi:adenylyltransferase/sulfurtransferase